MGTPDAPTASAVRPYLREFLSDPRVIDLPAPLRWTLVNGIIAPFRAPKSAHAYQSIWQEGGSPLLVSSQALAAALREKLAEGADDAEVVLAMRYGRPSLADAAAALRARGIERVLVFPLYPQYSSATFGSTLERVAQVFEGEWNLPSLTFVSPFYDHPGFLDAVVAAAADAHAAFAPDHVLFSYHGLPERHLEKSDPSGAHCLRSASCCDTITRENAFCYRAQCVATTRGLVSRLRLAESAWSLSFQSRLGRQEWIKPYTEPMLHELAQRGVKRLAVYCPAFVADCLETLEEIGVRAREDFIAAGGEDLALMPCVNAHPAWVDALIQIAREHAGWFGRGRAPPPSASAGG